MFYVYRFLDKKKNIIYVGKSKQDLEQRFRGHLHLPDACYDLTYKIEYIECITESDMSIKEIYYINKYRHDGDFFNVLDTTDTPVSVEFNDKWKQYKGPLGAHFHHSINYLKGYTTQKEVKYNKDGTVDRRKTYKKKGVSDFVEGLQQEEVNLIVDYLISEINNAENKNQEQLCFRNFVIFILGINLPHKSNSFLSLRYCDLFDEENHPKAVSLVLNRAYKDEIIEIPQKENMKNVLTAYAKYCGLSYHKNSADVMFQTREHQTVSPQIWGRILKNAANAVGIKKNIGSETIRKTYGRNVFNLAEDKLNALVFLEKLWGAQQYGNIIAYLNLTDDHIDYDYYFGETFSLGDVDISKIGCLKKNEIIASINSQWATTTKESQDYTDQFIVEKKSTQQTEKGTKYSKRLSKEKKLEIVRKHLEHHIPQEKLAKEYKISQSNIYRWVRTYIQLGEAAFIDTQIKPSTYVIKTNGITNGESASGNIDVAQPKSKEAKKEPVVWYVDTSPQKSRTNKVWTKEIKLEIVKKNLVEHILQNELADEYGVPAGNISRWVREYQKYGENAFEDKRLKQK